MRRILVLQMCRLGDLLQTTPMLRGIRREQPGAEITLVLHDGYRELPVPRSLFDRLVPFPYGAILEGLRAEPGSWPEQVGQVRAWTESLGPGTFDLAINLTHTPLSSFLMSLVRARRIEGAMIAPDRTQIVRGPWTAYFWAGRIARAQGCFNLVDLQNWAAGVQSDAHSLQVDVPAQARDSMAAWLAVQRTEERPLIAVQLGASEERKRWPPECFAAALNLLPGSLDVVFVGTRAERPLAERALGRLSRPAFDAVGLTSLSELAALLERAAVLLTNDTGTMHVASAVGTRIVDISTGPAFVHETGPYGKGHLVIEPATECFPCIAGSTCGHIGCREAISPADVAALVLHALGLGPLPRPGKARILTGSFLSNGRVEYRTAWPRADREEHLRRMLARVWESTLPVPGGAARELDDEPGLAAGEAGPVVEGLRAVAAAASRAARHADRIPSETPGGWASALTSIRDETVAMRRLAELEPACLPLVRFLELRLASCADTDLAVVSSAYARELRLTAKRAAMLADLLEGRLALTA